MRKTQLKMMEIYLAISSWRKCASEILECRLRGFRVPRNTVWEPCHITAAQAPGEFIMLCHLSDVRWYLRYSKASQNQSQSVTIRHNQSQSDTIRHQQLALSLAANTTDCGASVQIHRNVNWARWSLPWHVRPPDKAIRELYGHILCMPFCAHLKRDLQHVYL